MYFDTGLRSVVLGSIQETNGLTANTFSQFVSADLAGTGTGRFGRCGRQVSRDYPDRVVVGSP